MKWGWDDTATTGNNTLDGCALFDTDGDGFANYSFCVIVSTSATVPFEGAVFVRRRRERQVHGAAVTDPESSSTATATIVPARIRSGAGKPDFDPTHLHNNACDANPGCNTDDMVADTTIVFERGRRQLRVPVERLQLPVGDSRVGSVGLCLRAERRVPDHREGRQPERRDRVHLQRLRGCDDR